MEPKIVTKSGFKVVGMKYHGKSGGNEIKDMWGVFTGRMHEITNDVGNQVSYGVSTNFDNETKEFDYIACLEVHHTGDVPQGMVSLDVPGGTYAVFSTTLPTLLASYDHAFHTWLPQSGYKKADQPDYEEYSPSFNPEDPNSEFLFFIPLQKV